MSGSIGIDESTNLIYEGLTNYGYGLSPSPILSPATFVLTSDEVHELPSRGNRFSIKYLFREEGFDPVSRTRRGRFYKRNDQQPNEWFVQPHPVLLQERRYDGKNELKKMLYTYSAFNFFSIVKRADLKNTLVLIGHQDTYSIYSIINVESTANGDDLITLKMRPTFGVIPNLNEEAIPIDRRRAVRDALDLFATEVHRASPQSIIDRARDAASAILGAFNEQNETCSFDKDLGQQIKAIEKAEKRIVLNSADIIRIFHARAKPSEQERRNIRPISEQDAELAVNCIGTILCELGWAKLNI